MRRPVLVLVLAIAAIGVFTGGLAWLLTTPPPRPGAPRAERLWVGLCAECHGADGRGSWRAALFLMRPGDLADPADPKPGDRVRLAVRRKDDQLVLIRLEKLR